MDDIQHLSSLMERLDPDRVPAHVAIIMDGNGRWAKARGLDRSEGHVEGVTTVRRITEIASEAGVKCLTLYAFSTENWHRPQAEVDALMHLIGIAIERETPDLIKNNVRLTMIVNAARSLAARAAAGELAATDIDEALFASSLSTASLPAGCPDPDLLIRTGGDLRVSNFLLWQIAYAEIAVTQKFWPDFSTADFVEMLLHYQGRERRFGLTSEQVSGHRDK